ncbi:MAG: glutathione S-transferase family protein [Hyphomicrobiales bacterium]|nr:glutathione S-transferase family protein [Hyphomicrobiales bacterium]
MLALYHFDRSTAAQKVRLSLAEKGLAWESRYVDPGLSKRQQHDAAYLALNPRGVVPTLIHDGKAVRESQVILEYLEDVFPTPPLRPAEPFERAQIRLWTKLIDEFLHVDSRTIGQCVAMRHVTLAADPEVLKRHYQAMPEETRRDNDRINNEHGLASPLLPGALRRFKRVFHDMEHALASTSWLTGESFSLADISLVVYVARLASFQLAGLTDDLPRLKDWYVRIRRRPSYAEAIEKWGDTTSGARLTRGQEAFPTVKALWDDA